SIARVQRRRAALHDDLQAYGRLPWYPGERELYEGGLIPSVGRLDEDLASLSEGDGSAWPTAESRAIADVAEIDRIAAELLDLNHEQSFASAARVLEKRRDLVTVAVVMDGVAVSLAIVLGGYAVRVSRRLRRLGEAHEALLESRTQELEVFADRVAHDILSPLSAVSFLLGSIDRQQAGPQVHQMATRAMNALGRSRRLVQAILDFSQSGGRPIPGARADVPEVVGAVVDEATASPDAPPIRVEQLDSCDAACDPSVLSVVLANLVGNAVKHTKESRDRTIAVRARRQGARGVRFEVQDAGPGVPSGLEKIIFEPYRRGQLTTQPGLGLGLATVQRFVTSHGGSVGVERAQVGSIFWVELPLADGARGMQPTQSTQSTQSTQAEQATGTGAATTA
ncbi:MAG TPA: HAMP domain-containing sensor histidine kinase, partial [Polyangiaceae bacterium]|nr:HAMP domain-containing sensor histidine kinase [Polyangiaceae bacterium]